MLTERHLDLAGHLPARSAHRSRWDALIRKKYFWPVLMWPLAGLLLIFALWVFSGNRLDREKEEAVQAAFTKAETLASTYDEQLQRNLEQIDQLTLLLKFNWEESGAIPNLKRLQERGAFPDELIMSATMLNARGDIISTTMRGRNFPNFSDTDYFRTHKMEDSNALNISQPGPGRISGVTVIRFTRRMNNSDGNFAGVVSVVVPPSYLGSFHDGKTLGVGDFISLRYLAGDVIATKVGGDDSMIFFRQNPDFPANTGTELISADQFVDRQARIVSWKKMDEYPLVVLAAVSEKNALSEYQRIAKTQRNASIAITLLIAAFTAVGMAISARLIWRRQREEQARRNFSMATDAANEGFYTVRPLEGPGGEIADFLLEDCNARGAEMLGLTRDTIKGCKLSDILPSDYSGDFPAVLRQAFLLGAFEDEMRVAKNGLLKATWVYRRMVRSDDVLAITIRDISKPKEHEHALSRIANTDALTALPNRHWLTNYLPELLTRIRAGSAHVAVLFIDLDNFKNVNDTLGHDAGDELLKAAALRLQSVVRESDHVVRLGGDEFTIVLEQVESTDDVARIARSVIKSIGVPFLLKTGNPQHVNASIGISVFPDDGMDSETLLKHADIAMYAAKAAGKGRFYFYQTHFSDTLLLKLNKERALHEAVAENQFVIYYQPRVGIHTGCLSSMEALLRWQRPGTGLVYPDEFIGLAEDSRLIVRIGEIVIDKVCAQLAAWQKNGLPVVPVSVNVSGLQLKEGGITAYLSEKLREYDIDAALIEIELTESSVIDKSHAVASELAGLRALGIKLLIDDFGTGYSSLAQLHQLDVDALKVDQVFTSELTKDGGGEVLFKAIVSMAAALNIRVVAEGVETDRQLQALRRLCCHEIQGHLVSPAIAPDEIRVLMKKQHLLAS